MTEIIIPSKNRPSTKCYQYFKQNNYQYYKSSDHQKELIELIAELSICGCCKQRKKSSSCDCKKKQRLQSTFISNIAIFNECKSERLSLSAYLTKLTFCRNKCKLPKNKNDFEICYNCKRSFFAIIMLEKIMFRRHISISKDKMATKKS